MKPAIKRHGNGIYSKWCPTLYGGKGGWAYYVQYYWKGKRVTEKVEADRDGRFRLKTAQRVKADREKRKNGADFVPPHLEARAQAEAAEAEQDARAPLRFEVAAERFIADCASEYADPRGVETKLRNRLARFFGGRYLDEIERRDVRQYYVDRVKATGPFADCKPVSVRTPETEITVFSALYSWWQDEVDEDLSNPCHRPNPKRSRSLLAPYRPARSPVIPTPGALAAIFGAAVKGDNGRDGISEAARVLWRLVYYTAARPESEPCKLTHGDVELSNSDRWGAVTYRDTKTGADRRVLLHPEAEAELRAILKPEPIEPKAREAWRRLPIFRKRGKAGEAWDRHTYRKAWRNAVDAVLPEHPELKGMRLRDLRPTAKTRMIDAGVAELTTLRILGHRGGVAERYYQLTDDAMQRAIATLGLGALLPARDAAWDAGQDGQCVQSVVASEGESSKSRRFKAL